MTYHDVKSGNFSRARAHKGEIPDLASCHVMRHGPRDAYLCPRCGACTCPRREDRPAAREAVEIGNAELLTGPWLETFEENGEELRWDNELARWVRPSCPLHGRSSSHRMAHPVACEGCGRDLPVLTDEELEICPECGQERFEIELADCVWWGCGCGDHLTAMMEGGA